MKIKTAALFVALLASASASAQTQPAPAHAPPDIVLLQKGWSAESRNPALDEDPFAGNVEFRDAQRAQKINDIQNAMRGRSGIAREPPPPRKSKDEVETEAKKPLPSTERQVIYTYRAKVKNTGAKTIRVVHWAYAFLDPDTQQPLGLHRYSTKVTLRPGKSAELAGRSGSPQTSTVSAATVSKKLEEMIVIFRVEYEDGAVWEIPLK